jgi:capsule polysaccharide export protein KpsE/RkpR
VKNQFDLSFLRNPPAMRRIGIITAAFIALALLYVLVAPKWYRSSVTVVPAKSQRSGIGGLAAQFGGDAAALAAGYLDGAGGGADAPRIAAVLQSNAVSDAVIEKFSLRARYDQKYQEPTRDALWSHCEVKTFPKPQLVQISCEDKDPERVQAMLAFFAEHGNQVFRRVGVSSASEEVRFLEKHVAELRQQANDAAARMREFQEQHRIVDLDTQAKAVVSALATLNSQRIAKQLELDYARTFSSGEEVSLRQLESQLHVMGEKQRTLEDASPASPEIGKRRDARNGLFPAALEVPKLRAEFENLYRERKVAEATLVFALERLEGARATEAREISTFVVLDPPTLPTRPSWPRRLTVLAISALAGLAVAVGLETLRTAGGLRGLLGDDVRSRVVSSLPPAASR